MRTTFFKSRILLLLTAMLMLAGPALAVTPANTTIENIATLNFDGLGSPIEASVNITVTLLAQPPTLSRPIDNTIPETDPNTVVYRLTTNANGPDDFLLTQTGYNTANLTGASTEALYYQNGTTTLVLSSTISLGATAAKETTTVGNLTITVPYDGDNTGSNINGLSADDLITIGANDYEIASISENPATGTAIITLKTTLLTQVDPGTLITEYQLFDMFIATVGTVATDGLDANIDVATKAASVANSTLSDTDPQHRTNVSSASFKKYVRNIDTVSGTGTPVDLNGTNFYSAGVTAIPGETLEYALVIETSTTGLTNAVVTDTPPAFTIYQTSTTFYNANGAGEVAITDNASAPFMPLTDTGHNLGTIPGSETWVVKFQVKLEE